MSGPSPAFTYSATIARVYDGDTVYGIVDLGFGITHGNPSAPTAFRIRGIDTPEMRGREKVAGKAVRDWLRGLIEGKRVVLRTFKGDKYGRWLCDVLIERDGEEMDCGVAMVALGYAKAYDGGTKSKWTDDELTYVANAAAAAAALAPDPAAPDPPGLE